jgi:hypothetical protein
MPRRALITLAAGLAIAAAPVALGGTPSSGRQAALCGSG